MASSNILVLGNGYLGSFLIEQLRSKGHTVQVASKNGTGDCLEADLGSLHSIQALADQLTVLNFIPDAIVHCASSSRGGPDAYQNVFVEGIKNILATFATKKVILTSSTSVYPQIDGGIVTETSPADPDRETGKYLRTAEDHLVSSGGIALRLAGIYGPDRSVHLKKMLAGTATIESGEVSRWLNQIHRDDAASSVIHFLESTDSNHWGQIYNVADDSPISQRQCYEALAAILSKPIPGESEPDKNRKRAWTHKQVSNEKLKATGWKPQFPAFTKSITEDPRLLPSIEAQV